MFVLLNGGFHHCADHVCNKGFIPLNIHEAHVMPQNNEARKNKVTLVLVDKLPFSRPALGCCVLQLLYNNSINQSLKFISNQIKKLVIQCIHYNIHTKLFYNKHLTKINL